MQVIHSYVPNKRKQSLLIYFTCWLVISDFILSPIIFDTVFCTILAWHNFGVLSAEDRAKHCLKSKWNLAYYSYLCTFKFKRRKLNRLYINGMYCILPFTLIFAPRLFWTSDYACFCLKCQLQLALVLMRHMTYLLLCSWRMRAMCSSAQHTVRFYENWICYTGGFNP